MQPGRAVKRDALAFWLSILPPVLTYHHHLLISQLKLHSSARVNGVSTAAEADRSILIRTIRVSALALKGPRFKKLDRWLAADGAFPGESRVVQKGAWRAGALLKSDRLRRSACSRYGALPLAQLGGGVARL